MSERRGATLRGKVAVVTGAAHGIGRALAAELAGRGARVALLDLDQGAVTAAAEAVGGDAASWTCDVTDAARCEVVMGEIAARFNTVDILINNAGISHHSLADQTDVAVIRRVMEVNFFGAVNCTLAALGQLRSRRGIVVAVSSVAGFAPLVGRSAYAASKHALHGWFDTLRAEVADDGVAVLVACPSFVDTGIDSRALGGDGAPAAVKKAAVGRLATAEDIARAIVDGVERRRRQLVLTPVGKASFWLSRFAPPVYERLMRRRQAGVYTRR